MSITLRAKRILTGALAGALVLGLLPAGVASANTDVCDNAGSAGFPDSAGATHQPNVDCMAAYGIIDGRDDGTFGGSASITRAQFATLVVKFANLGAGVDLPVVAHPFTDVAATNVHADNIARLFGAEIINGKSATTFAPSASISRAEAATVLKQAHEALGVDFSGFTAVEFSDVSGTHAENIGLLAAADVINGTSATTFAPSRNVTRAETASLLKNSADVLSDLTLWTADPLPAPAVGAGITDHPELASVAVRTVGTTYAQVAYTFTSAIDTFDVEEFGLVLWDGSVVTADASTTLGTKVFIDPANNNTAVAIYSVDDFNLATATYAAEVAVTTGGKDSLGAMRPLKSVNVAGGKVLDAPNLLSVSLNGDDNEATFVFDEDTDLEKDDGAAGDFVLVLADGTALKSLVDAVEGVEAGSTSRQVTVAFADLTPANAGNVVRAYVASDIEGMGNVTQSVVVSANGVTANPDLISVTYAPGHVVTEAEEALTARDKDAVVDRVVFRFDEAVTDVAVGTDFTLYNHLGEEITAAANDAFRNPSNTAEVVVFVDRGTVATAIGASVAETAVEGLTGAGGRLNEVSSVARANQTFAAGAFVAPVITGMTIEVSDTTTTINPITLVETVTPSEYKVTLTFDKPVAAAETVFDGSIEFINDKAVAPADLGAIGVADLADDLLSVSFTVAAGDPDERTAINTVVGATFDGVADLGFANGGFANGTTEVPQLIAR